MSKYKGHSFKKEQKKEYLPPLEVQVGCVSAPGMRDLSDWEKWEKSVEQRKNNSLKKAALERGDKNAFLSQVKGSVSERARAKVYFLKASRAAARDSRGGLTESSSIDDRPLNLDVQIFKDDNELSRIRSAKFIDNRTSYVNVFGHATDKTMLTSSEVVDFEDEEDHHDDDHSEVSVDNGCIEVEASFISEGASAAKSFPEELLVLENGMVSMRSKYGQVLPAVEAKKIDLYFGETAKNSFRETYRELDRRRKIMWSVEGNSPEDELARSILAPRAQSPFTSSVSQLCDLGILDRTGSRSSRRPRESSRLLESNTLQDNSKADTTSVSKNVSQANSTATIAIENEPTASIVKEVKIEPIMGSFTSIDSTVSKVVSVRVPDLDMSAVDAEPSGILTNDIDSEFEEDFFPPSTYDQQSPRAMFLTECLKHGMPPRTSAMIRRRLSSRLSLTNQGIGDSMALILAASLDTLPFVMALDMADNNLTDESMKDLFEAIERNPNIVEIDFSTNDIDSGSAEGLAKYLSSSNCSLKKLYLKTADLDDSETAAFVDALMKNTSLEELDLSGNLIGKDETLNAVKPGITTGGEALATLLREDTCVLKTLKIAWNMIRMDSAVDLCDSLSFNSTLTYLDVSYNTIGTDGGNTLGRALLTNKCLKKLIIKNNMIDPVACFTICVGARETSSLKYLDLDGNPIGEAGARALMTIPLICGGRLDFSAKGCDLTLKSNQIILNRRDPVGRYELNMKSDYGRAVLFDIFDIVANHPSLIVSSYSISQDEGKKWENLAFKKAVIKKESLTSRELKELARQKSIMEISQNEDQIIELFEKFDEDGSGELDAGEFAALLSEFGILCTEKEGEAIMKSIDTDGGGLLELNEIMAYVRQLGSEAPSKIFNIEHRFCLSLLDKNPPIRYTPPPTGHIRIQVLDSFVQSADAATLTRLQCMDMIESSKQSSNSAGLLGFGADNVRMRVEEAEIIHSEITKQTGNGIAVLSKLLPLVNSVYDARRMLNSIIGSSQSKAMYLKKLLGQAYRPIIGIYDGYYCLDLSKENDRVCLAKLFEQNNTTTAKRKREGKWDISQDGNWSSFRNECRSGSNASICVENFTPIPKHGHLEFDFSGSNRPIPGFDLPISDRKLLNILSENLKILPEDEVDWARGFLRDLDIADRKTISGQGYSFWASDFARAKAVSMKVDYLYGRLRKRKDMHMASLRREFLAIDVNSDKSPEELASEEKAIEEKSNPFNDQESVGSSIHTKDDGDSINPEGVNDGDSASLEEQQFAKYINYGSADTIAERLALVFAHGGVAIEVLCICVMEYVETFMSTRWIKAKHLALLLACFQDGMAQRTEWGSYRVELVVLLYTRLLDIHNFEFVLMNLNAEEHACVVARIGLLNLFNPWKPEGSYQLDLSRWEERQIAKMLAHLSVTEPGENWIRCEYTPERGMAPMPGWSLNITWFTEEGFPSIGILTVHQFSGDGIFRKACQADLNLRTKLLSLVLIDPKEISLYPEPISIMPIKTDFTFEDANRALRTSGSNITWTYAAGVQVQTWETSKN